MSISKIFGLDKLANLFRIIQQNGGIRGSLYKLYRQDELKDGTLVGEDKYGNKYFENPRYFYGRNRWVEYSDKYNMNYDASQVPPEWFGWLHYKTDLPPHQDCISVIGQAHGPLDGMWIPSPITQVQPSADPSRPKYKWMSDWTENLSGTTGQYTPYSTTTEKVEAWIPPKKTQ